MFEQTFVDTRVQARKPAAVAASFAFQTVAIGGLLLIPLLHTELLPLPKPEGPVIWMILTKPPAPPPVETVIKRRVIHDRFPSSLFAPRAVPERLVKYVDEPDSIGAMMPGLNNVVGSVIGIVLPAAAPPPPPAAVKPVETARPIQQLNVSKGVQAAKLIFGPKPQYPVLARTARVQGTVHLQAIIGVDGNVRNLQVMSGPPLLVNAAVEAVSRWRYQPTLLTGTPVEVTTEIDVNFTLSQ